MLRFRVNHFKLEIVKISILKRIYLPYFSARLFGAQEEADKYW